MWMVRGRIAVTRFAASLFVSDSRFSVQINIRTLSDRTDVYQIVHRVACCFFVVVRCNAFAVAIAFDDAPRGQKIIAAGRPDMPPEFCIGIEMYGISLSNRSNSPMPNPGFGGSKFDLICIKADHYRTCIVLPA